MVNTKRPPCILTLLLVVEMSGTSSRFDPWMRSRQNAGVGYNLDLIFRLWKSRQSHLSVQFSKRQQTKAGGIKSYKILFRLKINDRALWFEKELKNQFHPLLLPRKAEPTGVRRSRWATDSVRCFVELSLSKPPSTFASHPVSHVLSPPHQEAAPWTARETSPPATRRTSPSPPPEGRCICWAFTRPRSTLHLDERAPPALWQHFGERFNKTMPQCAQNQWRNGFFFPRKAPGTNCTGQRSSL